MTRRKIENLVLVIVIVAGLVFGGVLAASALRSTPRSLPYAYYAQVTNLLQHGLPGAVYVDGPAHFPEFSQANLTAAGFAYCDNPVSDYAFQLEPGSKTSVKISDALFRGVAYDIRSLNPEWTSPDAFSSALLSDADYRGRAAQYVAGAASDTGC